jgi:hypothetical protein
MEAAYVLIPITLTLVSCIGLTCQYVRLRNRIVSLEGSMINLVSSLNTPRQEYTVQYATPPSALPPSAPPAYTYTPGYGYQYYPGNPSSLV